LVPELEKADLTNARQILGFEPKVSYKEGFKRTFDWYFANKNKEEVKANMNKLLMER
jgi:nucleoside-diphosphate-sugar epimerase